MVTPPDNSIHPQTRAEWRDWLAQHHPRPHGIWVITYKKGTGKRQFEFDEAVEEALCFGWIDSKPNKLDAERSMLWFAPRQPKTGWSKRNKGRIEQLTAQGLMMPAGLAKIETAKQDGSWTLLDAIEALEMPPDLKQALASNAAAAQNFALFPRSVQRGILEWIISAKKPETRDKRIQTTVQLAAENLRANQWRSPSTPTAAPTRSSLRQVPD